MTSMNISLPDALKAFVDSQVSGGGYSSVSEYVRELVRAEQNRKAKEALELELLAALKSGEPLEGSEDFWRELRREAASRLEARGSATR
jgi:antitoxin ParD1/3/4